MSTHPPGQPRHRRRLKDRPHPQLDIQRGVDRSDHPHRRQRIPTKVEERIIHPDPLESEDLA